jgi:hypothetical protein
MGIIFRVYTILINLVTVKTMNLRSCQVNLLTFLIYFTYPFEVAAYPCLFPHKIRDLGAKNGNFPRQYEGNPNFN